MREFRLPLFRVLLLLLAGFLSQLALSDDNFKISDIRVEGLQRVSAGTVFAALPLNVGDMVDSGRLQEASRTLFKSGYFDDIKLGRDGNVLVVTVLERPAIASIALDGNKKIETDKLKDGMKKAGLTEGLIFRRSILESMAIELQQQYIAQGLYGATVNTEVENLPQNRVALKIHVKEGKMAAIKHINIIGNTVFDKQELLDLFELGTTGFWSWASNNDKYSREKLEGDVERLRSYYMDRGYLRFKIDSVQVALSPDKRSLYITINISEGEIYKVNKVDLAGDIKIAEDELRRLIVLQQDQIFSQALMTTSTERIKQRLGNEGYNFAEVKELTDIDDGKHQVNVTFYVNPQERTYVRQINFRGNTKTADDVLRREMRQMESAVASSYRIDQSKVRLQRLGYFKTVDMQTEEVPGTGDQIDLNYTVEEQPSGSIGASIGFAQHTGVILGANIQQDNFFGTGKRVGFSIQTSAYMKSASFNYFDPYYTPDAVSRGFDIFYTQRDLGQLNVAAYSVDTYGVDMMFGYPISEIEDLGFGLRYANNAIHVGSAVAQEIEGSPLTNSMITSYALSSDVDCVTNPICNGGSTDYVLPTFALPTKPNSIYVNTPEGFLDKYGNTFNSYSITATWRQSALNRGRLPTRGESQSLSGELTIPGSDLQYWKATYRGQYFQPLTDSITLRLHTRLGYGGGYGSTDSLPFFENYFAGGLGSVRGYQINSVGPHDTPAALYKAVPNAVVSGVSSTNLVYVCDNSSGSCTKLETIMLGNPKGEPFGGNALAEGGIDFIVPTPFVKDQRSTQTSIFVDSGSAFNTQCGSTQQNCYSPSLGALRYSYGVGITWITAMGPLSFSFSRPIHDGPYDHPEFFQFSLGQSF